VALGVNRNAVVVTVGFRYQSLNLVRATNQEHRSRFIVELESHCLHAAIRRFPEGEWLKLRPTVPAVDHCESDLHVTSDLMHGSKVGA
jgi:hypothetical protein